MKSIRVWMMMLISLLVVVVIVVLSIFFYIQFRQALNQRVLLQLTSIMNLKSLQIEAYFKNRYQQFSDADTSLVEMNMDFENQNLDSGCVMRTIEAKQYQSGFYDLSPCSRDEKVIVGMVRIAQDQVVTLEFLHMPDIQEILLERTGMGDSGETYLVGDDLNMRSLSRFYPDDNPMTILASTDGVLKALAAEPGSGIIQDYRGVDVYSAYRKLDIPGIDWVILSEIDVKEVTIPLSQMRNKLILISIMVCLTAVLLSLLVTSILTRPLFKMRDLLRSMSAGKYHLDPPKHYQAVEIREMFKALDELRISIGQAIRFSSEIGNMNLEAQYQLSGKHDELGKSLIRMREQLAAYEQREKAGQQVAKRSLIAGQENERRRLAREMHDGLGPLLTSLKLSMQSLGMDQESSKKINTMLDHTIAEIRRITYDLMPPALTDFGIGRAMEHFVELIRKSSGLEIHYEDVTKENGSRIGIEMHICLFRVCQELLNNALKHSGANRMVLSITEFDDKVSLYYSDNGKGFDVDQYTNGSGLKNIRERIAVFNGYLHIASSENGTTVEIELPIHDKHKNRHRR